MKIARDILRPPPEADKAAWANFQKFPESYKRIRIAFMERGGRHGKEAFSRSLAHFIKMTARGQTDWICEGNDALNIYIRGNAVPNG